MRRRILPNPLATALIVLNACTLLLLVWTQHRPLSHEFANFPDEGSSGWSAPADWIPSAHEEDVRILVPETKTKYPPYCDACGPGDALCAKYGEHNLARSRSYEGPNSRLRRVLKNAMEGKPTKIGVLGGSVTHGHGTAVEQRWTTLFESWWKSSFPKSETELTNGAVAASGSNYYSVCFLEHIDEDVDLVIVELAINDQRYDEQAEYYEWLLRALLALPKRPAVVNLQTMALMFDAITAGGDLHTGIANYYDTPVLTIRNPLLPHILHNAKLEKHYFHVPSKDAEPDLRHLGPHGHGMLADILISFTQRQYCEMLKVQDIAGSNNRPFKSKNALLPGPETLDDIPRIRLFMKYDQTSSLQPVQPMCLSTRTDKHPLVPTRSSGWRKWTWQQDWRKKSYLIADVPGSITTFKVKVASVGRIRITYLKSATFGLGSVFCWIDDDRENGVRINGYWDYKQFNIAGTDTITDNASVGEHELHCELLKETNDPGGGKEFRLIAVDAA